MSSTAAPRAIGLLALTAAIALAAAAPASAATIVVNDEGDAVADDGDCTLREAIVAADTNNGRLTASAPRPSSPSPPPTPRATPPGPSWR